MSESPLKAHGRAVVMGALAMVLSALILGAAKFVRAEWEAKANVADVDGAIHVVLDSLHTIHVQGDSTARRLSEWYCEGKPAGCR